MWQIRKFYPPLRDATIRTAESIQFIESNNENFLAYIIPNNGYNDTWQSLAVLVNSSNKDILVNREEFKQEKWWIVADNFGAGIEPRGEIVKEINIAAKSLLLLAK